MIIMNNTMIVVFEFPRRVFLVSLKPGLFLFPSDKSGDEDLRKRYFLYLTIFGSLKRSVFHFFKSLLGKYRMKC